MNFLTKLCQLSNELHLPAGAEGQLAALLELVATDPAAPTSVTSPDEAVDTHIADSLSALPFLPDTGPVVDIGSGAGFPGLPLAIAIFLYEQRKERENEEGEIHQNLADEYTNFLKLVLDNADLQLIRRMPDGEAKLDA